MFVPLMDRKAPEPVKVYARDKVAQRMAVLDAHLAGREFLLDAFTVADAYLTVVLNWTQVRAVDLGQWPQVQAHYRRMLKRPSISRAVAEEWALYEQERAKAATVPNVGVLR